MVVLLKSIDTLKVKIMKEYFFPITFILLYGSGFVFTQYGLENVSPMLFLLIRFFIAFLILFAISYIFKLFKNIKLIQIFHISIAGMLTVGVFSIGVYLSLSLGTSASLSSLIITLQPLLVTILAAIFLKEKITFNMYLGLCLGLVGVFFIVGINLENSTFLGVLFSIFALLGLSFGSLYQKKYCSSMNLFAGGAIQTFASALLVLPFLYFENRYLNFNLDFIIALSYMSIAVSIGALSILYIMIKNSEISKVSSVFYLIPISALTLSFILFDKQIDITIIIGVITIIIAMILINKKEKNESFIANRYSK